MQQNFIVFRSYNNINSQLDATVIDFIDRYNQLNVFWW